MHASPPGQPDPTALLDQVLTLRTDVERCGEELLRGWTGSEAADASLANMAHYVALRRHDLRMLQRELTPLGLSSLGRLEGHVLPSLDAVAATLGAIAADGARQPEYPPASAFFAGQDLLHERADQLLGPTSGEADVRIMVTLAPGEPASAEALSALIARGASVFRINCAHDRPRDWAEMIRNARAAGQRIGRDCRILVDLAGPKVRTAEVATAASGDRLVPGSRLLLVDELGVAAEEPFQFRATIPGLPKVLVPGNHVLMDDGRVDMVVTAIRPGAAVLEVVRARSKGERLRSDRGLNIPGVRLPVEPLTPRDLASLDFAVEAADIVGLSFVRQPSDIALLQEELARRCGDGPQPGIIAKVELLDAFRQLPEIVVAGSRGRFGVMIARGDLAVEVGFERLVEVQEEILWLCEAAHVPVIWATQVLEGLSKEGMYSRAEVTDAAMGTRAECVMLNKGDHLPEAVAALTDLLKRMAGHQRKKSAQLRALTAW